MKSTPSMSSSLLLVPVPLRSVASVPGEKAVVNDEFMVGYVSARYFMFDS